MGPAWNLQRRVGAGTETRFGLLELSSRVVLEKSPANQRRSLRDEEQPELAAVEPSAASSKLDLSTRETYQGRLRILLERARGHWRTGSDTEHAGRKPRVDGKPEGRVKIEQPASRLQGH